MPSLNSVSKLFRKRNTGDNEVIEMSGVTRTLSLMPSWSGMKASLGAVSGVVVEVTHIIPSPGIIFDATQPAGKAGAVTPSKFSLKTVAPQVGVGVTVPPAVAVA